jgi:uncharacterized membrane protein YgcG
MMFKNLLIIVAFGLGTAQAQYCGNERILNFDVYVEFIGNGEVKITEHIEVCADNNQINRGIFRTIPSKYVYGVFQSEYRKLEFVEVLRNGEPEPWRVERHPKGATCWIGDEDVFLKKGLHRYQITYITDRQIRRVEGSDSLVEFYWNVTGNYWEFNIDRARLFLPYSDSLKPVQFAGYVDKAEGKNQSGWHWSIDSTGQWWVASTDTVLTSNMGFSVAVSWPTDVFEKHYKGYLNQDWFMRDFGVEYWFGLGLIITTVIMFIIWLFIGKDPLRRATMPTFEIPGGHDPAVLGFVKNMGHHRNHFSATVTHLAALGHLKITRDKRKFILRRELSKEPLSKMERDVLNELVGSVGQTFTIERSTSAGKTILEAQHEMHKALAAIRKDYFRDNYGAVALGFVFVLASMAVATVYGYAFEGEVLIYGLMMPVLISLIYFPLSFLFKRIFRKMMIMGWGYRLPAWLFAAAGSCVFAALLQRDAETTLSPIFAFELSFAVFTLDLWAFLLKSPTKKGAKLMEEIRGLKLYLTVAESKLLDFEHCPKKTPETFEKYLPYAIALGVESRWNQKFSKELVGWEKSGRDRDWYSTRDTGGAFSSGIGASIASASSSAASQVKSSSGSSGGGSSGGGGGGGGGGGW